MMALGICISWAVEELFNSDLFYSDFIVINNGIRIMIFHETLLMGYEWDTLW